MPATRANSPQPPAAHHSAISVLNPATGESVGAVRSSTPTEVGEAIGRARRAQKSWAAKSFDQRAAIVRRLHDAMLERPEPILDAIQKETGKARRDALSELLTVAGTARYYLAHGEGFLAEERRQGAVAALTSARLVYKPLGVVGMITPWNYPFLLVLGDALPALMAGNAVVVKPSELTPLSAEKSRELLLDAGLEPDLFQLVHGDGPEVGPPLIDAVDYISFTGSTAVGRKVAVAAAERLIPCSLELGGKNPMIVLADAPVSDAVAGLTQSAFSNAGQTCIAIERVFVERPIYDRFVEETAEAAKNIEVGWSLDWDVDMGCLISAQHTDKVFSHIEEAVAGGAEVLAGGRRLPDLGPTFLTPTVLAGVEDSMSFACEETFGPVVSIEPFEDLEATLERANATPYGLNASVWGRDDGRLERVARRLDTGSTGINSALLIYASFDTPMGGVKESGLGRRHGEHGIRRFTEAQSIVRSFSTGGGYEAVIRKADSATAAGLMASAFKLWRRIPFLR